MLIKCFFSLDSETTISEATTFDQSTSIHDTTVPEIETTYYETTTLTTGKAVVCINESIRFYVHAK